MNIRKSISLLVISLLIGVIFFIPINYIDCTFEAQGATIYVPQDYGTIQEAIDNATAGDTIYIWAGKYIEHILVNKTLTIIGNGTSNTTIDGSAANIDVVHVTANWVNISGFTINNSGLLATCGGITLTSVSNCHVYDNYFSLNNLGVHIKSNSDENSFENNTFLANGYAFRLFSGCDNNDILDNKIINSTSIGIGIDSSPNNSIIGNRINASGNGIHLWIGSNSNIVERNILTNNSNGIFIFNSNSNTLRYNNIQNNFNGINISSGAGNTIYHNNFINNINHAIDGGSNNWDSGYPLGGNYWDNYTGADTNYGPAQNFAGFDEMGDSDFTFYGRQDNYPYMNESGWHRIFNMNTGLRYPLIQWAVDNATESDSIWIKNGSYYENVIINKTLNLTGMDRNGTIIDAYGNDNGIYITADWVNITGLTITRSPSWPKGAVSLKSVKNCHVYNNNLWNNEIGIYLSDASYNNISTNDIKSSNSGIYLIDTTHDNEIYGNNIKGGSIGLYLMVNSYNNTFIKNNISDCGDYGICFEGSNGNNLSGNYIYNATDGVIFILANNNRIQKSNINSCKDFGIHFFSSSYNNYIINSNIWNNYHGVSIDSFNDNNNLIGNTIYSNTKHGIHQASSVNNTIISRNTIYNHEDGIYFENSCENNKILKNNISSCSGYGIYITASSNNTISNNDIFSLANSGIYLHSFSKFNIIENNNVSSFSIGIYLLLNADKNTVLNNYVNSSGDYGICLEGADENEVIGNYVTNNNYGIVLPLANNNKIFNNIISNQSNIGIYILGAAYNLIYNNDFINNTGHASNDNNTNKWNLSYPLSGNSWDNYTGNDIYYGHAQNQKGADGIGDTPFTFSGGIDYYPILNASDWSKPRFAGGKGTKGNPYLITNVYELQNMQFDLDGHYKIINDINASITKTWNNGVGFLGVGGSGSYFNGTLDGQGYNVTNLYADRMGGGLFDYVTSNFNITNVNLLDLNTSNVGGGIVYYNYGSIMNCTVTGIIDDGIAGGLIAGVNYGGKINNCSANGNVSVGWENGGGIVGINRDGGWINDCHFEGIVDGGRYYIGGLVGSNYVGSTIINCTAISVVYGMNEEIGGLVGSNYGIINNCIAYGNVTADEGRVGGLIGSNHGPVENCTSYSNTNSTSTSVHGNIGGLIGYNSASVSICNSFGNVSGLINIGGLIGENRGSVTNCYSYSNTTGENQVGGLIGENRGVVTNCYSIGYVTGNITVGGLIGSNTGTGTVKGCLWNNETSEQIEDTGTGNISGVLGVKTSFLKDFYFIHNLGWDFNNVWNIKHTLTYPFFTLKYWNDPPTANDNVYMISEDSILFIPETGVLVNDYDIDTNDILIVSSFDNISKYGAIVVVHPNGTFTFNPMNALALQSLGANEFLTDSFNYSIFDGKGGIDSATVFIKVTGLNDAPIAKDDYFITNEDSILGIHDSRILNNDSDIDISDSLEAIEYTQETTLGANFKISSNGSFIYDPINSTFIQKLAIGEFTIDAFTYFIKDSQGIIAAANISINVSGLNDKPSILDDSATIDEDSGPNEISVMINDFDIDSDTLSIIEVTQGFHGSVIITDGGSGLTYEPNANFAGSDWFNYTVSDGDGGTDIATVSVNVINTNDAPIWKIKLKDQIINENDYLILEVLAEDIDIDDKVNYSIESEPNCNITINSRTGTITWSDTQKGDYKITITASDGIETIVQTFNITVKEKQVIIPPEPTNNKPTIDSISDQEVSVGSAFEFIVTGSDQDTEDVNRLVFSLTQAPDGMVISKDGSILWIPNNDQVGEHTILVSITDGKDFNSTSFIITVKEASQVEPPKPPKNNPPKINPIIDIQKGKIGEQFDIKIKGSDPDNWDAINLSFSIKTGPEGMIISKDGDILWLPNENQVGEHDIIVSLSDGKNETSMSFKIDVEKAEEPEEPQEPEEKVKKEFDLGAGIPYLIILLIVGLIIGLVIGLAMMRKKKPKEQEQEKLDEDLEEKEPDEVEPEEEPLTEEELEEEELKEEDIEE